MSLVASGFRFENKTKEQFQEWLRKLPTPLKISEKEQLWEQGSEARGIVWMENGKFSLY